MVKWLSSVLVNVAVSLLAGGAFALVLLSLRWPVVHDLPIMLYEGYLIQEVGLAPYRDFFDMNPPGTMMLYAILHQITAGGSLACRLVDIAALIAIGVFTCLALRRNGWKTGVVAWACFAIAYLSLGPNGALQREMFCVLLVAVSAALVWGRNEKNTVGWLSFLLCGLLAGMAVTIKPLTFLCWPPLLLGVILSRGLKRNDLMASRAPVMFKALAQFFLGMLVSLTVVAAWLANKQALTSFLDIARHYYPIYTQIGGDGRVFELGLVPFLKRYIYLPVRIFTQSPFVILAFLGIVSASGSRDKRFVGQATAVSAFVVTALLYLSISGKFWSYHKIPLFYGLSLCTGFVVSRRLSRRARTRIGFSLLVLVAAGTSLPFAELHNELKMWWQGQRHPVKRGTVETISRYLRNHTDPSDTILPLDVTGGAVHAMYNLRRPLYGRFIYDFHFYHHVGHPYIAALRNELLSEFTSDKPEIVVVLEGWRPFGRTCSQEFSELDGVLRQNYVVALKTDQVSILRRVAGQPKRNRKIGPDVIHR